MRQMDRGLGASRDRRWVRGSVQRRWAIAVALWATTSVVAIGAAPRRAAACSPTPIAAHPLMPAGGAKDVPLNAVLIASSVYRPVRFSLREAATGKAIPLSAACEAESVNYLCHGRPAELAPNTAYTWSAAAELGAQEMENPKAVPPTEYSFTTGEKLDQEAPLTDVTPQATPPWTIEMLEHKHHMHAPCGAADVVRLRISLTRLNEPVVVTAAGMGGLPDPWNGPASILTPAAAVTDETFYAPPACVAVRLTDVAGNVRHLPPWCPPAATPASANATGPTQPEVVACAAAPGRRTTSSSAAAALALGLLMTYVRRRRRVPR